MKPLSNQFHQQHVQFHDHIRKFLTSIAGGRDLRGIELMNAIRGLSNCYENSINQSAEFAELSAPRLAILLFLMAQEEMGNLEGINPSKLSHFHKVNKNTISSLLRGLEQDGWIERTIDPYDKRSFLICITASGRDLLRTTTPGRIEYMNDLSAALTFEEKDQLLSLLEKLHRSIRLRREQNA